MKCYCAWVLISIVGIETVAVIAFSCGSDAVLTQVFRG